MSKKDLIDTVAKELDLTKDRAGQVVDAVVDAVKAALKDGKEVRIPDFGTFKVADRAARKGRNPLTGKDMDIAASKAPKFTAAKGLKELLNG